MGENQQIDQQNPNYIHLNDESFPSSVNLYDRDLESMEQDVDVIVKWLKIQPHLPEVTSRDHIKNFLVSTKFRLEICKQKIDNYYTMMSSASDVFDIRNPKNQNMQDVLKAIYVFPLPKQTDDHYRILYFKVHSPQHIGTLDIRSMFAHVQNVQEIRLREDCMIGDVIVYDLENTTMEFIMKMTPMLLAKLFRIYEKVYSIPMKRFYLINSPTYVDYFVTILKGILKPKLAQRIHVHKDNKILQDFPKKILPSNYGGEEKSLEELHELWKKKVHAYQSRFDLLDKLRVDESIRPGKVENSEETGLHGNFRKLNVD